MSEIVLVALVIIGFVLVTTLTAGVMALSRLRRVNCVSAGVDTGAPLRWLIAPFPTALLHRRLRDAVTVARAACPPPAPAKRLRRRFKSEPGPLESVVAQLEAQAVRLDHDLVLAARHRGHRRRQVLYPTARQIVVIERVAQRVSTMARTPSPLSGDTAAAGISRLHDEVLALEQARDEIASIERQLLASLPHR